MVRFLAETETDNEFETETEKNRLIDRDCSGRSEKYIAGVESRM